MKNIKPILAWILVIVMVCTNINYVKADTVLEGDLEIVAVNEDDSEESVETVTENGCISEGVVSEDIQGEITDEIIEESLISDEKNKEIKNTADTIASGTFRGMNWVIDRKGLLTISGNYEYEGDERENPTWLDYASSIKSVKVTAVGVKSTFSWFRECENIKEVDFSVFDTSKVTDMSHMFSAGDEMGGYRELTSLDVSGFDTSSVTDMSYMFNGCNELTSLDVSGFDTSSVTDMSYMFQYCFNLASLDVSGFNTSNVTNMASMFYYCYSLTNLDVHGFNTGSVTDMSYMFCFCDELINLDVRNFNTSNVTNMDGMFGGCYNLTSLNVRNFNTSNVTSMGSMFAGCSGLTILNVSDFDTSNVTNMISMFAGCSDLTNLDVSSFDTSKVTNMYGMFSNCSGLTNLDVSGFNTSNVTWMISMFSGCSSLIRLDISGFNTSNVTDMSYMFSDCSKLTYLDASINVSNVKYMAQMFYRCSNIKQIKTFSNLQEEIALPISPMYDEYNKEYTYFPTGLSEGIWLYTTKSENPTPTPKPTYTVTFDSGLGNEPIQITDIAGGTKISLPDEPIRDGYRFLGWYTEKDGKGTVFTANTIVNSDLYLYAYWRVIQTASKDGFWVSDVAPQVYTGQAIKPVVDVYDGETLLTETVDYTVSYKNNIKVNNAAVEKTAPTITVTGKGNYAGKEIIYFPIVAKDISDEDITAADLFAVETNNVQKPVPVVIWQNKKLTNKKDFVVSYLDLEDSNITDAYEKAGDYRIILTGINNFTGEREITFHITKSILINEAKVAAIPKQTYTGSTIQPALTVTYGKDSLTLGTDYTVSYKNNIQVGKATAILTGKGNYAGTKEVTFQIVGTSIAKATVDGLTDKVYNGKEQTQNIQVQLDEKTLTLNKDYQVSYTKNLNAGTATVTITGIGGYSGTLKKKFKITAYDLSADESRLMEGFPKDGLSVAYTKGGSTPEVNLSFNGVDLVVKKDYTITYSNNKKITEESDTKTPAITIKGKGNFKGTKTISFTVTKRNLTQNPVTIHVPDMPYINKAGKYISKPVLTDINGKKLAAGTDYDKNVTYTLVSVGEEDNVTAADSTDVGLQPGAILDKTSIPTVGSVIKVTITGKGNYEGTIEATYRIAPSSFNSAKITITPQIYTGSPITLTEKDITVKMGKDTFLTYGQDYEIVEGSYQNNEKKGTASVMIRGLGDYAGTKTVKFKITSKKLVWFWNLF